MSFLNRFCLFYKIFDIFNWSYIKGFHLDSNDIFIKNGSSSKFYQLIAHCRDNSQKPMGMLLFKCISCTFKIFLYLYFDDKLRNSSFGHDFIDDIMNLQTCNALNLQGIQILSTEREYSSISDTNTFQIYFKSHKIV